MKVLLCHNYYQQAGGEDQVFADEKELLERNGHEVHTYTVHNDSIRDRSKLTVAAGTIWNRQQADRVGEIVRRAAIDVAHFHNTFPLLSPAVWSAARNAGAAVVQTLHNFRLLCPTATLQRNGRVCTDCVGRGVPWPSLAHRCYRGSALATGVVAGMLTWHRWAGTYHREVDRYIALTHFAARWFERGGLPVERIAVKPNFVASAPPPGQGAGEYFLFVGRLSPEKGIRTLLDAWRQPKVTARLIIVGDGPLANAVASLAAERPHVQWLGKLPPRDIVGLMQRAKSLVMPSIWFEGFPKTLVEAFSVGTPVLASRLGAFEELVDEGRTGRLFEPGNPAALAEIVTRVQDGSDEFPSMRLASRREYEARYTAEHNYDRLVGIYHEALSQRRESAAMRQPRGAAPLGNPQIHVSAGASE